jgi:hypothetical protein
MDGWIWDGGGGRVAYRRRTCIRVGGSYTCTRTELTGWGWGWMEGWREGWTEGWKEGWVERWKDGRVEGWKGWGRVEGWIVEDG